MTVAQETNTKTLQHLIKFMEEHWVKGWVTQDPELYVTGFTPDAKFADTPFTQRPTHEGIRNYFQVLLTQKDCRAGYEVVAVTGNKGISKWWAEYTVMPQKDWPSNLSKLAESYQAIGIDVEKGNFLSQDGILIAEFNEDGLVTKLDEWWFTQKS
ncbi:hypothetical protein NUACC21_80700 [Scytonema sp. NUACC21]